MATILPIRKTDSIFNQMERMQSQIMKRAYELFDGNGRNPGRDLDDWLKAESEVVWRPPIDIEEKDNKIELQVAIPGVDSKDIAIEVTPEEVLIRADTHHEHEERKGKVHTCEFATGNMFRAVHLPKKIDPDKVKAEFKDGVLRLSAEVSQESQPRRIELKAS